MGVMKTLVVLPTYNERENIDGILERVLAHGLFDVLVVDDNSTDGTKESVHAWAVRDSRVNVMDRPGKLGLGTAYIAGFKWGIGRGYQCMMEMDSDFSHNPDDLPRLRAKVEGGAGLVIGSRYIGGTINVVGWDFRRLLLSKFGNIYASTILRMPYSDLTSGFRAFSAKALSGINLDAVHSQGYSFQIEMAYYVWKLGLPVEETPIIFTERAEGSSKMSKNIVREAVKLPWKLRWMELTGSLRKMLPGGIK